MDNESVVLWCIGMSYIISYQRGTNFGRKKSDEMAQHWRKCDIDGVRWEDRWGTVCPYNALTLISQLDVDHLCRNDNGVPWRLQLNWLFNCVQCTFLFIELENHHILTYISTWWSRFDYGITCLFIVHCALCLWELKYKLPIVVCNTGYIT